MAKNPKFWISKEYVAEIKKHLWHVWKTGVTHSECIDAFTEKSTAQTYCDYLNNNL